MSGKLARVINDLPMIPFCTLFSLLEKVGSSKSPMKEGIEAKRVMHMKLVIARVECEKYGMTHKIEESPPSCNPQLHPWPFSKLIGMLITR